MEGEIDTAALANLRRELDISGDVTQEAQTELLVRHLESIPGSGNTTDGDDRSDDTTGDATPDVSDITTAG